MVRDYQPSDLERILKIWLQSNLQAHDFIDRSYWEKNYDFVRCLLPQSQVLVWEQDGEVQGFAGIEGRNIEVFLSARSFAPRGLEQPYCKRQNGAFHPSRCRFTARTGGLFCFINGKDFR